MSLFQILSVVGVSGIISGLVGVFISLYIRRPMEKKITESEKKAEEAKLQSNAIEAQNKATMLGVQALLRDRLLQAYKFYNAQGWADYDEKTNMDNLYKQYEALGPNGIMHDKHERFRALPDYPPTEHTTLQIGGLAQ